MDTTAVSFLLVLTLLWLSYRFYKIFLAPSVRQY